MRSTFVSTAVLLALFAVMTSPIARAQGFEKGVTSYIQFGGTSYSDGHVLRLDSSVGYSFNRHFGIDGGVPIYFSSSSVGTSNGTSVSNNGIGDPYFDLRWRFE